MISTTEILGAIKALRSERSGLFMETSAEFAAALDMAFDGEGNFVVVSGEHYEFVDHVYWHGPDGLLFDQDGARTWDMAESQLEDGQILECFTDDHLDRVDIQRTERPSDHGNAHDLTASLKRLVITPQPTY